MSADITNLMTERAERAGKAPLKPGTYMPLIDAEATTVAEFLAPQPWQKRAQFFDNIIIDSLERMTQLMDILEPEDVRTFMYKCVGEMRQKISRVLSELDRLAPLPPDGHAMRLFRASADPDRGATASRYWPSEEAERAAMRPRSGCMVLRNLGLLARKAGA